MGPEGEQPTPLPPQDDRAPNIVNNKMVTPEQTEAKPERTRESEIQANIDLWKRLGLDVDEADVRREIEAIPEIETFNFYIYMPEGERISELFDKTRECEGEIVDPALLDPRMEKDTRGEEIEASIMTMPRSENNGPYAVATKFQELPDADSIDVDHLKSALEWQEEGYHYLNPREYLVARIRYFQETGRKMDNNVYIEFPDTVVYGLGEGDIGTERRFTPVMLTNAHGELNRNVIAQDGNTRRCGVRRIATKGMSEDDIAKLRAYVETGKGSTG